MVAPVIPFFTTERNYHNFEMAKAKLHDLRVTGEDTWDAVVIEMEMPRDAFPHSFNNFKSQF